MTNDVLGYYAILNCSSDVDDKTLKINYRDKAKFWHPDHNQAPDALEHFQKISFAYNILSNPQSRFVYDLLCLVYTPKDFPDMKTLKIYKSVEGSETPFLRVFKLLKIPAKHTQKGLEELNLIGTFTDSEKFIKNITRHNWLKSWQRLGSIRKTIQALKKNYHNINQNRADNFKMLIHNTAAYFAEDKLDKAALSLQQAYQYAPEIHLPRLSYFSARLPTVRADIPAWDFRYLQKIQLTVPKIIVSTVLAAAFAAALFWLPVFMPAKKAESINYYQEVRFNNGSQTVDDVVVAQVYSIPPDITDTRMLYHTTDRVKVMHGPSDNFDVMTTARMRQTVRLTGYTPDKKWFRVMLDDGAMGFVKSEYLKQGVGRDIPPHSKIFNNPNI